jgi:serine/threonine-protein kinase
MTPERWRRVDDLFEASLRQDPACRDEWLEQTCGSDVELRAEVARLLALDARAEQASLLIPPALPPRPAEATVKWQEAPGRRTAATSEPPDIAIAVLSETGGFTPKGAIAAHGSAPSENAVRPVVQARLRELAIIYILVFGMLILLRPYLLGYLDPTLAWIGGGVFTGLAGLALLLWGRREFSIALLRKLELGVVALITCLVIYYEYRYLLLRSLAGDPITAQLLMKNVVITMSILILTYGIYVPKSGLRAAALSFPLALVPEVTLLLLYLRHPEPMAWLGSEQPGRAVSRVLYYSFDALFLLVLAAVSSYGAHMLSRLRRQVDEARQLGQYRLKRLLGSGGMGDVFLAEHQLLKRPCAVKLIRSARATDPRALERFEREVRLTAKLSHPNTVEVYDYGRTEGGVYYYVMEYLQGLSLANLVESYGPLPPERVVHILRQVCSALHEAHAVGLIHRDVKPSNIFASRRGGIDDFAKLLDFGLVRPSRSAGSPALSGEGQILGTPLFMSPEQVMGGRELDQRSDLYSLGAVAYFLLTGRPPFDRDDGIAAMVAHARDPVVPPSQIRPGIPEDLERIVLRCLAKIPEERFLDAERLEQAMGECACADAWDQRRAAAWWTESAGRKPADRAVQAIAGL